MQVAFAMPKPCCCGDVTAVCLTGCVLELSVTTTLLDAFAEIDGWILQACSSEQPVAALQTGESVEGVCVCQWETLATTACTATKEINPDKIINTGYQISIYIECDGTQIGIYGSLQIFDGYYFPQDPLQPPEIYPGLTREFVIASPLPEFIDEDLACCPEVDENGFGFSNIVLPFTTTTADITDLPLIEIRIEDIGWNCGGPTTTSTTTPTTTTYTFPTSFPLQSKQTLFREGR